MRRNAVWACCLAVLPTTAAAQVDQERARTYFAEAAALCERDAGRLWGVSLCGPMVFADAATRTIATNQPAPDTARPPVLGFANAPVEWGGTRWAAYVWALIPADDAAARGRLLIHELFHRVQADLGLMTVGQPNEHLDSLDGRYWLQLEWRALAAALPAAGQTRAEAIRDALAFRQARRAMFPEAASRERADELREGLAQYTGTVFATATADEAVASAVAQLAAYAKQPTFVSTFAYPMGAAYGLLLDAASPGWTRRVRPSDDLGQLLMRAAGVEPAADPEAAAARYGGPELRAAEAARDTERRARVAELRRRFVDGPVVIVPRGRGAVVGTQGATPIPGEGTVFFQYRVTAEWGRLESKGILQSSDGRTLRLAAPFERDGDTLRGDGWTIMLAPGWTVRSRARDFEIVRIEDLAI